MYKINPVNQCFIRIVPDGEEINIIMKKSERNEFFQYFEVKLKLKHKLLNYRFRLVTIDGHFWYNQLGLSTLNPLDIFDFKLIGNFEDPIWVKESVFYQIFPDRFYDGNKENNVKDGEYSVNGQVTKAKNWNQLPESDSTAYPYLEFYGGDLAGIKQKIPHFNRLGINALYLNPIFHALSNHKYDTFDFKKIDPHFGTNEEFTELVTELHKNGIRIILDGVINHSGEGHYWFNRLNLFDTQGAYNDPKSTYREYYTFYNEDDPDDYLSWLGHKSLPVLNYKSNKLRAEIYEGVDSVIKYWLKPPYNIDGWRVDVANMLSRHNKFQNYLYIWESIRNALKNSKPESYLMGEHFYDPTNLLNEGNRLDAVMNYYGFYHPVRSLFTQTEEFLIDDFKSYKLKYSGNSYSFKELAQQLLTSRAVLPFQIQLLNLNLLDSHDTPRFFSLIDLDIDRFKLAMILLFTYTGIPSIYYGDEIGMEGKGDPDSRRPMVWDESKWNYNIFSFYQLLIGLRNRSKELQLGSIKYLVVEKEIFSFVRFNKKSFIIIVLSVSLKEVLITIPVWKFGFTNGKILNYTNKEKQIIENGKLKLILDPNDYKIFRSIASTN